MEHSADPAGEKAHRDGFLDGLAPAAEDLARRQSAVDRMNLAALDASDAVRLDAWADGCLELLQLGVDAEKWVVPGLACLGPDAPTSDE